MPVCNVQEVLDDGRCYAECADTKLLLGSLVSIGCQILNASDPMALCDVQSVLDEGRCYACASSEKELLGQLVNLFCQILVIGGGGGGGGGGAVSGDGVNYAFVGAFGTQILKLKNLDTGLCNRIDSVGADGMQAVDADPGTACTPVATSGGSTTGYGAIDPVALPAQQTVVNFYWNTATEVLWVWDPVALKWTA